MAAVKKTDMFSQSNGTSLTWPILWNMFRLQVIREDKMFLLHNLLLPRSRNGHQNPVLWRQHTGKWRPARLEQRFWTCVLSNVFMEYSDVYVQGPTENNCPASCWVRMSEWKGCSIFNINKRDISQSWVHVICYLLCLSVLSGPVTLVVSCL